MISEGLDKFGVRFQAVDSSKDFQPIPIGAEVLQRLAPEALEASEASESKDNRAKDRTMKSKRKGLSSSHYVVYRIHYPDDELSKSATLDLSGEDDKRTCGWLIYIKSTLTKNEPEELKRFPDQNPEFPHDATLDQFFDPNRFMRYRQLGECLAENVYQECFSSSEWKAMEQDDPFWLANQWPNRTKPSSEVCEVTDDVRVQSHERLPKLEGPLSDNKENVIRCLESESVDEIEMVCVYLTCLDAPIADSEDKVKICELLKLQYNKATADVDLKMFLCNAFSMIAEPTSVLEMVSENLRDAGQPEALRLHLLELWRDIKTNQNLLKQKTKKKPAPQDSATSTSD